MSKPNEDRNPQELANNGEGLPKTEVIDNPTVEEPVTKPIKVDPYLIFVEMDKMRQAGVPEEVLREALNQFIAEREGKYRKLQKTLRVVPDMVKWPTEDEVAKLMVERVGINMQNPTMEKIAEYILKQENTPPTLPPSEVVAQKVTIKMYVYRILYWGLNKFLGAVIWLFNRAGIK